MPIFSYFRRPSTVLAGIIVTALLLAAVVQAQPSSDSKAADSPSGNSQELRENSNNIREQAVKVFLDVSRRYQEYIKTEIQFVNYVRDRKEAEIHIMMTDQPTGSGGREYTLSFIGQYAYDGQSDTLKCTTLQMDTDELRRRKLTRTIKLGLMRYVAKTPLKEYLSINYHRDDERDEVVDNWNYWVFNLNMRSRLNGEESQKEISVDTSVSADRVTPFWKISFRASADYDYESYETEERKISSTKRSREFRGLVVKSLTEHWSYGGYCEYNSSIYRNTDDSYNIAPAIEFNVFPYSESTRREFRFLYRMGYTNISYYEETFFGKMKEDLFDENLSMTYEIKEKWGSVRTTLEGSHYFHNFSKNRIELFNDINIRIVEGLTLDLFGSVTMLRDQLSLPKEGATEDEVLLHQQELATDYDYFAFIGLRYTFGSIYSNVVNPRFGGRRRYYD
ncbi:MAG: hypothetical protein HOC71_01395 [Candidatus Latescibacteria bacterium]|jgi:hypothetical protein|nr:hypothetical protein [Candidatus Latescibacterota bacterium]